MKNGLREKIIVALFGLTIVLNVAAVIALSVYEINQPDPHEHTFVSQTVAPTCTQAGYILYTCECNESYKEDGEPARGHDYAEEFTVDIQPDCTKVGSKSKHCSRCESTYEVTEIPANGHDFSDWHITAEPRCAAWGTEERDCKNCPFGEGRGIEPLGHMYGGWKTLSEPSCETDGVKVRLCSRCDGEDKEISKALGHDIEYLTDVYYHEGSCVRCKTPQRAKHAFVGTVCGDCGYEVHPTQGLEYTLNEDGASYSVTGIGTATDATDLVIFSTYYGLPVTAVGKLYYNGDINVKSVVIYENVKELQDWAFSSYNKLTSVYLPSTLTRIGPRALCLCSELKEITVDGENPVYHSVDGKYIVETDAKTLFLGTTNEIPADGSVTSIGDYAFAHRVSRKEIIIPETITSIGDYAFEYSRYLDYIEIPSSVKSIGKGAFLCTDLGSVLIEEGVTFIGSNAFRGTDLNEVFIPKSVTQIGENVFGECRNLKSIVVDSQNPVYHSVDNCLIETQKKTLVTGCSSSVIPNDGSVTSIGDYTFFCCRDLVSIELPDSITSIGRFAFAHNYKLETIKISEKLTLIDEGAFMNCSNLKTIRYSGTTLQWVYIVKNKYIDPWDYDFPKDYRVICSNGILLKNGTVLPLE